MDPEATLRAAADAIEDGDFDDAIEYLDAYRAWRSRGGFEPPGGDVRCARLQGEAEDGQESAVYCSLCSGSGEGMADGTRCSACGGSGERKYKENDDD